MYFIIKVEGGGGVEEEEHFSYFLQKREITFLIRCTCNIGHFMVFVMG